MSDITPKAQELADEKGIDISSVEGSGKDGRVLVEDVEKVLEENEEKDAAAKAEEDSQKASQEAAEASMEAEDPAKDAEVVGEVAGDPVVVSQPSPETSVEAFKAHPHVPVSEQTEFEKKDFVEEELATVEGTPEAEAQKEEDDEDKSSAPAGPYGADDPKEAEEGGPGSTDYVRNRGLREKGFYVLPDETNPNVAKAEEEANRLAEEAREGERDVEQTGQVDTSSTGEAPSHGESLRQAAPSVGELAGEEAPDAGSSDDK